MDQKTLLMLEFPQIVKKLASYASFSSSQELAEKITPITNPGEILYKLQETTEARHLLSVNDNFHLGGCINLRAQTEITRKGGTLDGDTIYRIGNMLINGREIYRSISYHTADYPKLAKITEHMQPPKGLIERIQSTVNDHGEVMDSASEKLANIRREIRESYNRLLGKLEGIMNDTRYQTMLQEAIITQRDGRYVIPLKSEYKGQLKAIVHDQSASGATIFVEPLAAVDLNNTYHELQLDERNEVLRILQELSGIISDNALQLNEIGDAMAAFDFALMRARYAEDLKAAEPILTGFNKKTGFPIFKLYDARHPLIPEGKAVPIDVVLDDDTFSVVISGPNTGGKTVTLKTIGLMILMAQSGLHIPVQSGSEISVFENVFADIGDEQSIEQSLSTFSGHITNVIRILNQASRKSLVLMDELGSGTDPQEGSALARAILKYMTDRKIPCFVASHYSELKAFAHVTEGCVNASMEFNLKTLRPTYRLSIGLPGRSNAILIAERLGLPQEILDTARSEINPEEINSESLLDEIRRQLDAAKKARSHADRMRSLAENNQKELQKRLDEIETERQKMLTESHAEVQDQIDSLKDEAKILHRRLERAGKPLDEVKKLESEIKDHETVVKQVKTKIVKPAENAANLAAQPFVVGQKVKVRSLGTDSIVVISSIDPEKKEAEILMGSIHMRVPLSDLIHRNESEETETEEGQPAVQNITASAKRDDQGPASGKIFHESPGVEIDLRGQMADDASEILEKYLDNAFLAGLPYVRIIHGKGTGKLRQVTRQILLNSENVKFIEPGRDNEGGDGVTIAHLKTE